MKNIKLNFSQASFYFNDYYEVRYEPQRGLNFAIASIFKEGNYCLSVESRSINKTDAKDILQRFLNGSIK